MRLAALRKHLDTCCNALAMYVSYCENPDQKYLAGLKHDVRDAQEALTRELAVTNS